MAKWVALIRGINVGGANKLSMTEIKSLLAETGFRRVQTYIQSGNIIFEKSAGSAGTHAAAIQELIRESFGFEVHILVLRGSEIEAAIKNNPFADAVVEQDGRLLHLFFLGARPVKPDEARLNRIKAPSETWRLVEKAFYLHTPEGFGRSKLAAQVEKILGVPATARNWRTVIKIAELMRPGPSAAP